jgi:hypothetical protein
MTTRIAFGVDIYIGLDEITSPRFGVICPDVISALKESIEGNGQLQSIGVRLSHRGETPYVLLYGKERLEACHQLGEPFIRAQIWDMNDEEAYAAAHAEDLFLYSPFAARAGFARIEWQQIHDANDRYAAELRGEMLSKSKRFERKVAAFRGVTPMTVKKENAVFNRIGENNLRLLSFFECCYDDLRKLAAVNDGYLEQIFCDIHCDRRVERAIWETLDLPGTDQEQPVNVYP